MRKIKLFATIFLSALILAQGKYIKIPVKLNVGLLISKAGKSIGFPGRFTMDSSGNFYIQDMDTGNIHKFASSGIFLKDLLNIGIGREKISSLKDFFIYGDRLYVIDASFKGAKVFDLNGKFLFSFKTKDIPNSLAVSTAGEIFIPDYTPKSNSIISVFDSKGVFLRNIGTPFQDSRFTDPKKFYYLNRTLTIKVSTRGGIYVLSNIIPAVRKYSPTGELIFEKKIEGKEVTPGAIDIYEDTVSTANSAVDLGVDNDGYFIVSLSSTCAYLYSSQGNLVAKFGVNMGNYIESPQKFSLVSGKIASVIVNKIFVLNYAVIKRRI